jgi:hypothetical protein
VSLWLGVSSGRRDFNSAPPALKPGGSDKLYYEPALRTDYCAYRSLSFVLVRAKNLRQSLLGLIKSPVGRKPNFSKRFQIIDVPPTDSEHLSRSDPQTIFAHHRRPHLLDVSAVYQNGSVNANEAMW